MYLFLVIVVSIVNGVPICPNCAWKFAAKIGYISHIRVQQRRQADSELEVVAITENGLSSYLLVR